MTSLHPSPVKAMPSNGSLPQSRTNSLTPSVEPLYSAPNGRNSSGSYRPNGSFTYGMDNSYLTPQHRQPTTGGISSELGRLPSESESRPSASGASDSELYGDDSDIWLKRSDGTDFGQEHEVWKERAFAQSTQQWLKEMIRICFKEEQGTATNLKTIFKALQKVYKWLEWKTPKRSALQCNQ